jgi:hypothetical protein
VAGTFGIPALALAGMSSWSNQVTDLTVAFGFALALPGWINVLTLGGARRKFGGARYPLGWLLAYALFVTAAFGTRLHWPAQLSIAAGLLALLVVISLGYGESRNIGAI